MQKDVFMVIQASLTLVCLAFHFLSLKFLLLNAWVGCLAIVSVALYFFGIMGSSAYQELPKEHGQRNQYFPEVFRDFAVTVRVRLNLGQQLSSLGRSLRVEATWLKVPSCF